MIEMDTDFKVSPHRLSKWEREQERRAARRRERFINSPLWELSAQGWWRRWKGIRLLVMPIPDAEDRFRAGVVKAGRWQWAAKVFETESEARSACLDLFDAAIAELVVEASQAAGMTTEGDDDFDLTTENMQGDNFELSTEDTRVFSEPDFTTEQIRYVMSGTEEDFDLGTTEWPLSNLPPDFPDPGTR